MSKPFAKIMPRAILKKPDAKWNVSGLFSHDKAIWKYWDVITDNFSNPRPIASVHGSPPVLWNGGRFTELLPKERVKFIANEYVKRGIPMYLTFSNYLLGKEHLNDKSSNYLLDMIADTEGGGVIAANDLLIEHIREKHPNLKIIFSLVKTAVRNKHTSSEYYEDMAKQADMVVIHPDDTFNYPLLNSLRNKDKFEIMVNENCIYKCKVRYLHYSFYHTVREENIEIADKNFAFEESNCLALHSRKQNLVGLGQPNFSRTRNCNITEDEFLYLYDIGFRHFKIQGRSDPLHPFIFDLCRFTLDKQFIEPLIFKFIMDM